MNFLLLCNIVKSSSLRIMYTGVNATCVEVPKFVKDFVIPLKCVKCEDNVWSFNGTLGVGTLKACFSAASYTTSLNVFVILTTAASAMFFNLS